MWETNNLLSLSPNVLISRIFFSGRNYLFDQEIERVDWAEPEPEVDEETMKKVIYYNFLDKIMNALISRNFSGQSPLYS